jgi:hypothetical protein
MAQQSIDYGNFPDDSSADAIRIAFQKTQDNFTELYGNLSNIASNVTAITAGSGIMIDSSTGDVTIDATFSSLNVHSNTLTITGVGGIVTPGGNIGEDYTVNNASSTLIVELNSTMDVEFANILASGNLTVDGSSISASNANIILANGNITLSNGSFTGDIFTTYGANTVQFANSTSIVVGDSNFTYSTVGSTLTLNNGNLNAAIITSQYQLNAVNVTVSDSISVTNSITAESAQIDSIQFAGLTSDPTPSAGLLYYNSTTGKLRLYNGITTSWQDLN